MQIAETLLAHILPPPLSLPYQENLFVFSLCFLSPPCPTPSYFLYPPPLSPRPYPPSLQIVFTVFVSFLEVCLCLSVSLW